MQNHFGVDNKKYSVLGFEFVVAFSGGKDSIVLLDLVSKELAPDNFYVVFSNTGMELSTTITAIEEAKRRWPDLRFREAKSHLDPESSWEEFGPPGRRMRWCCSVHKSVPTILKLRELTGNYNVKAVVFDGVRAEESAQRAGYDEISVGAKNINQVNCSPILKWNSAELYTYILGNLLPINYAYRIGMNRVGCTICPMSSGWRDSLCSFNYSGEIKPLLSKVEHYSQNVGIQTSRLKGYIEQNGWRTRMGGRGLQNGGNRVIETIENNTLTFELKNKKQNWLAVAVLLGPIVEFSDGDGVQIIGNTEYSFTVSENGSKISYKPYSLMNRFVISHLRGVANKVAYCIGCKACMVQCPCSAFVVDENSSIYIREDKCSHCANCIEFTKGKGCLVAKSLSTTEGSGMDLKGMNRYQTFGLRQDFLEHFFEFKVDCFGMNRLGNRQYDALKVWLKEAELLTPPNKGDKSGTPSQLYQKIERLGAYNPLTWAVIWTNLAYNSVICKWYMLSTQPGEVYEKNELVFMLGDDYSQSTRDNAVTALLETLRHSPIGSAVKQGIPISVGSSYKYARQGWENADAVAVLYALYKWAENTGNYTFSLRKMIESRGKDTVLGVDPGIIFGINDDALKEMLQSMALQMEKYIRVSFVMNLDNVILSREITSLNILDLVE